jgi:hypothetical protein
MKLKVNSKNVSRIIVINKERKKRRVINRAKNFVHKIYSLNL